MCMGNPGTLRANSQGPNARPYHSPPGPFRNRDRSATICDLLSSESDHHNRHWLFIATY